MPEQFAFEEVVGKCGAVDGDKGLVSPWTVVVNRAGDELFSRSALAGNQDSRFARRDSRNHLLHLLDGAAFAHHRVFDLHFLLEPLILSFQPLHILCVFEGNGSDGGDCGQQLEVASIEADSIA